MELHTAIQERVAPTTLSVLLSRRVTEPSRASVFLWLRQEKNFHSYPAPTAYLQMGYFRKATGWAKCLQVSKIKDKILILTKQTELMNGYCDCDPMSHCVHNQRGNHFIILHYSTFDVVVRENMKDDFSAILGFYDEEDFSGLKRSDVGAYDCQEMCVNQSCVVASFDYVAGVCTLTTNTSPADVLPSLRNFKPSHYSMMFIPIPGIHTAIRYCNFEIRCCNPSDLSTFLIGNNQLNFGFWAVYSSVTYIDRKQSGLVNSDWCEYSCILLHSRITRAYISMLLACIYSVNKQSDSVEQFLGQLQTVMKGLNSPGPMIYLSTAIALFFSTFPSPFRVIVELELSHGVAYHLRGLKHVWSQKRAFSYSAIGRAADFMSAVLSQCYFGITLLLKPVIACSVQTKHSARTGIWNRWAYW